MTVRLSGSSFAREIREKSQAHLERCSQCLTCGSGCPVAFAMDNTPNQIIRMVQFGMRERALDSSTIWLCASCQTCAARCPNDIDIVKMMDTLREMAIKEGRVREKDIVKFHTAFIESIREKGRVHETSLMGRYIITSGDIFRVKKLKGYINLGLKMLTRGKLSLTGKTGGRKEVQRIFRETGA